MSAKLKSIVQFIKQGEYEKADKEIQAADKDGLKDLKLFLFGIVVANNLNKENTAFYYLDKAKSVDSNNPEVLKAECAIYEKFPGSVTKKSLPALESLINDEKTSAEKLANLKKIRWIALLRLRMFYEFLTDPDLKETLKIFEICDLVLKVTKAGEKIPFEVVQEAFVNFKDQFNQPEHLFGLMFFERSPLFLNLVLEHVGRFGCDNPGIFKAAYSSLVLSLIDCGQIPSDYIEIIQNEKFYPTNSKIANWLKSLLAGEISQAYDKLLNLTIDDYGTWPLCGLALYNFLATRQFNRVLGLYRLKKRQFPNLDVIFRTVEVEASFENHGDISELRQLARNLEKTDEFQLNSRILEIYTRIRILIGEISDDEILKISLPEIIKDELLVEYFYDKGNYSEVLEKSEKIFQVDDKRWRTKLLQLKCQWKMAENSDDVLDDVRAFYGENSFVADILVLMAEIYFDLDEMAYARQIIDHAVKVNPSRQTFREIQDKIYAKANVSIEERIDNLNHYVSLKPYCMWAVRHSTVLEIQNGRFDEAVSKLRRVIHAMPDHVGSEVKIGAAAIWGYVGLVNFHRGQFLSTMYAFESAVSLDETNSNYLFLLALSQRNIYQFDKVFTTLKKLKSVESSSVIKKLARELFLECIILFALDMTPGKVQLHQLLIFFKIIGKLKTTDWISSKVLTFAIVNALTLLRKYNSNIVETFLAEIPEFSNKFSIFDTSNVFDAEIAIVLSLLVSDDQHVGVLNEAGLRILDYAFEKNSTKLATLARKFFKKAIQSSESTPILRSYLYVNFGLTFCVGKLDHKKAVHCFLRSLQLCKQNATALSLLGFVSLGADDFNNSRQSFNSAHILEPEQMEHWCGRAILGEIDGYLNEFEIMNNYQHSLTIKPCRQAVESFVYRLIEKKSKNKNFNRNIFFDYKSVSHLSYLYEKSDDISYSLAIIAEHFRHFDEASTLIEKISNNFSGIEQAKKRIFAATRNTDLTNNENLERLETIYHGKLADSVVSSGEKLTNLIRFLLSSLAADDWRIFWKFYQSKFYPIIVGFVNLLDMNPTWGKGIHSTIREGRPQHKLLEVFPTITPKNEYAATRRPKEDENAFIRYDPAIEPLFELLQKFKDEYDSKTSAIVEDDFPVILSTQISEDFEED